MSQRSLTVIWRPEDARAVFERAATIQAIHAVAEQYPQTVRDSRALAALMDGEGL